MRAAGTGPTVVTYGPFIYKVKGSQLNSGPAKNILASLNLDAASRKAVLAKYGKINTGKTYSIRWYNKLETIVISVNGYPDIIKLLNYALKHNIIIGAICGAVDFMARNGFLTNFKHTGNDLNYIQMQMTLYLNKQ